MFHSVRHVSIDEPLRGAGSRASSKCFKFDDKRFATVSGRFVRQSMDRDHQQQAKGRSPVLPPKRGSKLYSKIIEMNRQSMMELEEELVAGGPSQRNWKGVGIAFLVIIFICSLIGAAVFLLTPNKDQKITGTKFNLSELLLPKVNLYDPQARWLSAHVLSFRDVNRTIWKMKLYEENSTVKYDKEKLLDGDLAVKYHRWHSSPDGKYVAMINLKQKHTRRSSSKIIHIFETQTSSHKVLNDDKPVLLFLWAPISYPAALAYVDENNNLWYQKDAFDPDSRVQITNTGSDNIYNGVSDWLYEEEIFESNVGSFFSKSGSKIAFVTINDTLVKRINFDIYSDTNNYPETQSIPYPKVGEILPSIVLHVHFLNQSLIIDNQHRKRSIDTPINRTIVLKPPKDVEQLGEYYLINGNWISNSKKDEEIFVAVWSNRVQNVSYFSTCQVPNRFKGHTVQCKLDYTHRYLYNWLTPSLIKIEFSTDDKYFTILPQKMYDGYNYAHVAWINYSSDSHVMPRFITTGQWEVTSIVGFDAQKEILYFIAAYPTPIARHLMSVSLTGKVPATSQCLTCHMVKDQCNSVSAEFSSDFDYFVLSCQGPGVPKTYLVSAHNETILTLSNNTKYAAYFSTKLMPKVQYDTADLGDGYEAQVKFLLPATYDGAPNADSYPLVLKVYSGPGSQLVLDTWSVSFDTYLVSSRNYIVAYIDGRGSGNRGSKYTGPVYRRLGTVEVEDQITAIKRLFNATTSIRRDSIAVWGWSYGGFVAAHIVKQDRFKTFKCAASVAPVTNFLYYDAAYTERYMGLNKTGDNYDGYQKTIVNRDVSAFGFGKYLLAHGTGDDNVHFQNSAMLVEALVAKGVQFQFMAYTNQQHSISDNTFHLYTMLDNFFVNCFQNTAVKTNADDN